MSQHPNDTKTLIVTFDKDYKSPLPTNRAKRKLHNNTIKFLVKQMQH